MQRLEIRNLAIIDALELKLGPGLNVFSGETGAGKSIIVDAIWLLTGGRADTELVRQGAESLLVTGFWPDHILSRRITGQGRSVVRVDAEVVTVRELGEVAGELVTVHWQHAAQALLNPAHHRELLDRAMNEKGKNILHRYSSTFQKHKEISERLEELRSLERERARRLDTLRFELREIESANIATNEEINLRTERERLLNAETITENANAASMALTDGDVNALALVQDALKALSNAGRYDAGATQLAQELREVQAGLKAIGDEVQNLAERTASDPARLDVLEGRLALLERLKTKYGATLPEVLSYSQNLRGQLKSLESEENDIQTLERQLKPLETELNDAAQKLSEARNQTANRIGPKIEALVQRLGIPKARLEFALETCEATTWGRETVELRFSANSGEALGTLNKIASGGELSRVMLAICSLTGATTPTVIFDEIDAGVGGQAATAVGEELARLARDHQVLVVTHLAQIAARANQHHRVYKEENKGRTRVATEELHGDARIAELARMLSGSTSEAALAHARELLKSNGAD